MSKRFLLWLRRRKVRADAPAAERLHGWPQ
jgi:hypothetical protein